MKSNVYLVYIHIYQVYDRSFSHALSYGGAFSHALSYSRISHMSFVISLSYTILYIYRKTLLQLISSPYSPNDGIIEYMELTSQDFMLSGFLWHVSNTDIALVYPVIYADIHVIWLVVLGVPIIHKSLSEQQFIRFRLRKTMQCVWDVLPIRSKYLRLPQR